MNQAFPIRAERLDLLAMTPEFLHASLEGDRQQAESLLGIAVPQVWYQHQALMRIRLQQLERDPGYQTWSLRAVSLRSEGVMVGHIGFHTQPGPEYLAPYTQAGVELGYTVYPEHQRQGFAREACQALIAWAHRVHGVSQFVVSIRPDNEPSLRLAHSLGFRWVGLAEDDEDGREDVYVLALGVK